jgi:hypothetical protein
MHLNQLSIQKKLHMHKIFPLLRHSSSSEKDSNGGGVAEPGGGGLCGQPLPLREPVYPFGDITIQPKMAKENSQRAAKHSKGKRMKVITPVDDLTLRKYDAEKLVKNHGIPYQVFQNLRHKT